MAKLFRLPRGVLPLLPLAPAIVVILGVAAAVAIALLGIRQLQQKSDEAAALRADALAVTLATRLGPTPYTERGELLGRAARQSAAEILLVDAGATILFNESFGAPKREDILNEVAAGSGEAHTALGRVRFAARPVPGAQRVSILTFVAAPSPPPGTIALVNAVAALTVLLLGIAVAVAVAFTKDARDDVDYVRRRIVDMARVDADPAGENVPIRSFDQVGVLTEAFNLLVARFTAAEKSYRADLVQAQYMDKERAAFLAGLSHELRTPLNAILGFAHVLESEVDGPLVGDAREYIRIIATSGEHLRRLIDDVLDLSALETGQLRLTRRAVDLREIADQVMTEARAITRDKPLRLEASGDKGLLANADPVRIRQILTNLVSNAIKATSQGSVTVHVEPRNNFVAFIVKDTGAGIPEAEIQAIFQEYRQSGDARSRRGGVGLGLAIAKRLVGMHGGTIDVKTALGEGSTFIVFLPKWVEGAEAFDPKMTGRYSTTSYPPPPPISTMPPPKGPA